MSKKNEETKPKKVLGTGAAGDPDNPEAGAPVGARIMPAGPALVVTETKATDGKDDK
jgi:hypothetical protein